MGLIFDGLDCPKQKYLWCHLAHDKHIQRGMGVLTIPGDWKRRLRAKRRRRAVCSRISSGTTRPSQVLRGGGTDDVAILSPSLNRSDQPSSSAQVENAAPADTQLYEFSLVDVRNDAIRINPQQLKIHWVSSDDVSEAVRHEAAEIQHAVETNGNGACAVHSVFGRPGADSKLFAFGARHLACRFLSMLPEAATTDHLAARALDSISTSLWDEFAKPFLSNQASVEGRLFWKALETDAPELAVEARQRFQVSLVMNRDSERAKREALLAARRFFTVANEEMCIRPLAVRLGYLGAATRVDRGSHGQLQVTCVHDPTGQKEGMCSARDEDGYVRGTKRVPYPVDGPDCKYSALFDPRPVFDALREAFMLFKSSRAPGRLFLNLLQEQAVDDSNETFRGLVGQWLATSSPSGPPPDFAVRAWSAYLKCVTEPGYYFSVDELLAICKQASVRVLIFKEIDGVLTFQGGSDHGQGPVILTKLRANNQRSVRSHFERLISASQARQFANDLEQEAQERLREEDRLRREKEIELAKVQAEKARREASERQALQAAAVSKNDDDVPPPPPASEGKRPAKKPKSEEAVQNPKKSEAGSKPSIALQPDETMVDKSEEVVGQYNVRCMPCGSSRDPRSKLEAAMTTLVDQLREHPTIPADSEDVSVPALDVLSDDTAPLLPPKHCAFKQCSWTLFWIGLAMKTVRIVLCAL